MYVVAISDIHVLAKYRHEREFIAGRAEDGGSNSCHGSDGKDIIIELPVGSIVTNTRTERKFILERVGQKNSFLKVVLADSAMNTSKVLPTQLQKNLLKVNLDLKIPSS